MSSGGRLLCVLLVEFAEQGEDLAGNVALEAADDLLAGLVLGCTASSVGAGGFMPPQTDDHDAVEGGVGLPVAAAVEPVADGLARGCFNRGGAAERGERGVTVQPVRVVSG